MKKLLLSLLFVSFSVNSEPRVSEAAKSDVPNINYNIPSANELKFWLQEHQGELNKIEEIDYPEIDGYELHFQGMIKLGEDFIVSAVDKRGKKKKDKKLEAGFLHKFRIQENNGEKSIVIVQELKSGPIKQAIHLDYVGQEMTDHHPGGIDIDRQSGDLIIPIAQYNPNTTASFLLVNSQDITTYEKGARVDDHIGTIICAERNSESCHIIFNWDSKNKYELKAHELLGSGVLNISGTTKDLENPWALQDCKYIETDEDENIYALCTATKPSYDIVLIRISKEGDLKTVKHIQAPTIGGVNILGFNPGSKSMAQNPMSFERIENKENATFKIRFYFMPHDHTEARLFVYETPEMDQNELLSFDFKKSIAAQEDRRKQEQRKREINRDHIRKAMKKPWY